MISNANGISPESKLIPIEEARSRVLGAMRSTAAEHVGLEHAHSRVAAEDVHSRLSLPPNAVSAMDGYALRSDDVRDLPVRLQRIGASRAGARFEGRLTPGGCVRIFTGAVVPEGADLIALQEDAREKDNVVEISELPKVGQYIRRAGLDFREGQTCIEKGRMLTARDIGLLAACGHRNVLARRKPRIAILSTGDELVAPGQTPGRDQIVGSNGVALAAAVKAWGGAPVDAGIAPDQVDALVEAATLARGVDLLLTSGGVSVGEHDLVQASMSRVGFVQEFWRIAMRPGKPLAFGRIEELPVLSLPGNPVSALVCALLFLRPAIKAMLGLAEQDSLLETAILGGELPANDKREDYVRARLRRQSDGKWFADPFPIQDSGMMMALARADALIRRKPHAPAAHHGDNVDIIRLDSSVEGF